MRYYSTETEQGWVCLERGEMDALLGFGAGKQAKAGRGKKAPAPMAPPAEDPEAHEARLTRRRLVFAGVFSVGLGVATYLLSKHPSLWLSLGLALVSFLLLAARTRRLEREERRDLGL